MMSGFLLHFLDDDDDDDDLIRLLDGNLFVVLFICTHVG